MQPRQSSFANQVRVQSRNDNFSQTQAGAFATELVRSAQNLSPAGHDFILTLSTDIREGKFKTINEIEMAAEFRLDKSALGLQDKTIIGRAIDDTISQAMSSATRHAGGAQTRRQGH